MVARKKAAKKKTPTKAKPFTLDDEPGVQPLPGGGAPFVRVSPSTITKKVGNRTQTVPVVRVRGLSGDETFEDSMTGVIVGDHVFKKFYFRGYDEHNPAPPDCASIDGVHGQPSEESAAKMASVPGYNGVCAGCPLAFRKKGAIDTPFCQSSRVAYLAVWDGDAFDPQPVQINVSRTADKDVRHPKNPGQEKNTFTDCFSGGKKPGEHLTEVYSDMRVNKAGVSHPVLRFKIVGHNPMGSPEEFYELRGKTEEGRKLLLPNGPDVKALPAGDAQATGTDDW